MKSRLMLHLVIFLHLLLIATFCQIPLAHALLNDSAITITSTAEAQAKRAKLIRFIWGDGGFPVNGMPVFIKKNDRSPVPKLVNLKQVDTLRINMEKGLQGVAHHFIPKRNSKNRLVILHLGHSPTCTFNDGTLNEPDVGMRRTLNRLLKEGYPVLAVYMPKVTPDDCRWDHNALFQLSVSGNPMKFFMEPTAVSLNYLIKYYPNYRDIAMIGLSGGGWTTTVYAAIDPRIKVSIPVAGTVPLAMRHEEDGFDIEQVLDDFYKIAGYPDLYILGSLGANRRQIQVLNHRDDCCFGEKQHNANIVGMKFVPAMRNCEKRVQTAIKKLGGGGTFSLYIDEAADRHMISNSTIEKVIIPRLRKE